MAYELTKHASIGLMVGKDDLQLYEWLCPGLGCTRQLAELGRQTGLESAWGSIRNAETLKFDIGFTTRLFGDPKAKGQTLEVHAKGCGQRWWGIAVDWVSWAASWNCLGIMV